MSHFYLQLIRPNISKSCPAQLLASAAKTAGVSDEKVDSGNPRRDERIRARGSAAVARAGLQRDDRCLASDIDAGFACCRQCRGFCMSRSRTQVAAGG